MQSGDMMARRTLRSQSRQRPQHRALIIPEDIISLERNPPKVVHKYYELRRMIREVKAIKARLAMEEREAMERAVEKIMEPEKEAVVAVVEVEVDTAWKVEGNRRVIDEDMVDLIVISSDEEEDDDEDMDEDSDSFSDENQPLTPVESLAMPEPKTILLEGELLELEKMFHLLDCSSVDSREEVMNFLELWKCNILDSFQKVLVDSSSMSSPLRHEFTEVVEEMNSCVSNRSRYAIHLNVTTMGTSMAVKIQGNELQRVSVSCFQEKVLEFIDSSSGRDISRLFSWMVEKRAVLADGLVQLQES